jgi:hypothetical protein
MLSRFVELSEAKPERIRDFARRWGVLSICEHDLPASHNPPRAATRLSPKSGFVMDAIEEPTFPAGTEAEGVFRWDNYTSIPPLLIVRMRAI